jgi:arsenite methyltransferase
MFGRFMAAQLGNPSGLLGRLYLAPMWNKRNKALNDRAYEALGLRPDDRVLEVGFGGGYLLERMNAAVTDGFISGADHSRAMVSTCEKRFRPLIDKEKMVLRLASSDALPFQDATFNKICSVNSIFFWKDAPQVFDEFSRVLEEGGKLVLVFTRRESLEKKGWARRGLNLYEPDDLHRMMAAAGFHGIEERLHKDQHREFWCMTALRQVSRP